MTQVANKDAILRINKDSTWIEEADLSFEVSESDGYALEEGLRIKEKVGGEVVVCSMGPQRAKSVIKDALDEIEKNLDKLTGLDQLLKAVNDLLTAAEGLAPGQKETLKNVKDIVNTLQDLPSAADILAIVNLIKGIITKLEAL